MGMIAPSRLAVMTPHEMASEEMKELRAKLTKEAIDDHQMAQQGGTKSDLFKCNRCGQRDTTYNQVVTQHCTHTHTVLTAIFLVKLGRPDFVSFIFCLHLFQACALLRTIQGRHGVFAGKTV